MHRITVENDQPPARVTATGELDAFVASDLSSAFDDVGDARFVLVDLERVSFLDSTALGLVVRAVREIGERGGVARVVLPASTARRIFEITTLDRVLPIAASREEGLAALTAPDDAG